MLALVAGAALLSGAILRRGAVVGGVAALGCAEEETECEAPALLALGKLGGRELNFSSDVDLLFLYDVSPGSDPMLRAEGVTRLVRLFKANLERPTGEGFGYRVDLDLRPEGRAGALANSVDALLTYYESFGSDWERQMLIRLRTVVDAPPAAEAFTAGVHPYVYSRHVGPDLLRSVRDMKIRIEAERRPGATPPKPKAQVFEGNLNTSAWESIFDEADKNVG